jgi:hypothetical protein
MVTISREELEKLQLHAVLKTMTTCMEICLIKVKRPAGYKGSWEGYGEFEGLQDGEECASSIAKTKSILIEKRGHML